jgi:hypothetical protein
MFVLKAATILNIDDEERLTFTGFARGFKVNRCGAQFSPPHRSVESDRKVFRA